MASARKRSGSPAARREQGHHAIQSLIECMAVNERMNQILLEQLDSKAWRAVLPGPRNRTIAALFAHVHNIRLKWLRLSAPHLRRPAALDRSRCTPRQAAKALAASGSLCIEMLREALLEPDGRVRVFHRDGWARPWPAGPAMVAYMIAHEAHHRGQAGMLARQLGFPLPAPASARLWAWERLWRECGFTNPR